MKIYPPTDGERAAESTHTFQMPGVDAADFLRLTPDDLDMVRREWVALQDLAKRRFDEHQREVVDSRSMADLKTLKLKVAYCEKAADLFATNQRLDHLQRADWLALVKFMAKRARNEGTAVEPAPKTQVDDTVLRFYDEMTDVQVAHEATVRVIVLRVVHDREAQERAADAKFESFMDEAWLEQAVTWEQHTRNLPVCDEQRFAQQLQAEGSRRSADLETHKIERDKAVLKIHKDATNRLQELLAEAEHEREAKVMAITERYEQLLHGA